MIERRAPHQVGKEIAKGINNGNIKFFDKHLSMFVSLVLIRSRLGMLWRVVEADFALASGLDVWILYKAQG